MVGTSTGFLSFSEKNEAARNERGGWALASLGTFGADGGVPAKAGAVRPMHITLGAVSQAGRDGRHRHV